MGLRFGVCVCGMLYDMGGREVAIAMSSSRASRSVSEEGRWDVAQLVQI